MRSQDGALHYSASRGKNETKQSEVEQKIPPLPLSANEFKFAFKYMASIIH